MEILHLISKTLISILLLILLLSSFLLLLPIRIDSIIIVNTIYDKAYIRALTITV
jgi:hypothetical protein